MLMISTIPEAIGLMMVGIVLLGTWPAVWNLIEQRGRIPSHTFLDYALTYLLLGTAAALTLGQLGPEDAAAPRFLTQLQQDNGRAVAFALAGGFFLAFGDLGMQYATALLGLSIGPPLLNALTVIIGVVLAYFLDGGINKPQLVFPGMACAAVAIALGAAAHVVGERQRKQAAPGSTSSSAIYVAAEAAATHTDVSGFDDSARPTAAAEQVQLDDSSCAKQDTDMRSSCRHRQQHQDQLPRDAASTTSTTLHIDVSSSSPDCTMQQQQQQQHAKLQRQRSIQLGSNSRFLGLAVALLGGGVYGLFLPAFQIAATDPFKLLPPGTPPLTVWTTNFWFSVGFAATSIILNGIFLYKPPFGTQASSVTCYLKDNRGRGLSVLSGALVAAGDLSQFMGGQVAGYAACMLVMAYPVVGVLWGMARFKEWKQGSRASLALIAAQVAAYSTAVALLALSAELRTSGGHH